MSPMRATAGVAYLEYQFDRVVKVLDVEIMLWSGIEGISQYNGRAFLEYKNEFGNWVVKADLLSDYNIPTKNFPGLYDFIFDEPVTEIRFHVSVNNPSGDRNKGRICIGKMNVFH